MASEETREKTPDVIEMPAPTAWPLVMAFGLALIFSGVVPNIAVSVVGIVMFVAGAVGWWWEVLPVEKHEAITVRPLEQRAAPIKAAPQAVEHLTAGKAGHRVRIPVEIHPYSAGIKGGIMGAIAMAVVALLYGLIAYGSIWYPINLLSATAVPSLAQANLEQLRSFSAIGFFVGLVSHGVISISIGLVYAAILPMLPRHALVLWGGILGPLLWSGLIWASLGVIDPELNERIDWIWFIASQIAFGLTAGSVISKSEWITTRQSWSLAARAGLEAPGVMPEKEQHK